MSQDEAEDYLRALAAADDGRRASQ
jgi:hypothetical protein